MDKRNLWIVKIGGNVLDDKATLDAFLQQLKYIPFPFILIHGGGKTASDLSKQMGLTPTMVEGRRITDAQTLDIVTMVYAGLINKKLVTQLQADGINALGLCGADLNLITAQPRQHPTIDFGFVGEVSAVNTTAIQTLLSNKFTPVFSAITHTGSGQLLNTNADTIASALAVSLSDLYTISLCYCFEKKGVLLNPDDEYSVIEKLSFEQYQSLKQSEQIHSGMIPKLDNAFNALHSGVADVKIILALQLQQLINNKNGGTQLVK